MRTVAILRLDRLDRHPDHRCGARRAGELRRGGDRPPTQSVERLAEQARELRPQVVALGDASRSGRAAGAGASGTEVVAGPTALADVAPSADVVVNGVVGFAGSASRFAALEAGKRLALANKESLIAAGPVVQRARLTPGAELVPVDSEALRSAPVACAPTPAATRAELPASC